MRGALVGGTFVAALGMVSFWVVQVTGTAAIMMGDLAEQWTAGALRRLQRRGWRVVNNVPLAGRNVDHLLVGPGGVFAVETKWTATAWSLDRPDPRVREAVSQVRACARTLGLWSEIKSIGVTVRPVVFLWGGGLSQHVHVPGLTIEGCSVVSGPHARTWSDGLPGAVLAPAQVDRLWTAVDRLVDQRDAYEQAAIREPVSIVGLVLRFVLAMTAAAASFLACAQVLERSGSFLITAAVVFATVVGAVALHRAQRLAAVVWGSLFGCAVFATIVASAYAAVVV